MQKVFWHNVQIVRLLSTFGIVGIHSGPSLVNLGLGEHVFDFFRLGTDTFLAISGFLTCYIFMSRSQTPKEYIIGRLIRIMPMYWIATFCYVVFKLLLMSPNNHESGSAIIQALFMLPIDGNLILYQTWSLALIVLYAFIAAISFAISRRWGGLIAFAVCFVIVLAGLVGDLFVQSELEFVELYSGSQLLNLGLGGAVAVLMSVEKINEAVLRQNNLVLIGGIMIAAALTMSFVRAYLPFDIPRSAFLICAILILLPLAFFDMKGLSFKSKIVDELCNLTFMIYLIHPIWLLSLDKITSDLPAWIGYLAFFATPLVVIVMAFCFHHFLEKPVVSFLEKLAGVQSRRNRWGDRQRVV